MRAATWPLGVNLPGPSASLRAQRVAVGEPVAVAGYPLHGLLSGVVADAKLTHD